MQLIPLFLLKNLNFLELQFVCFGNNNSCFGKDTGMNIGTGVNNLCLGYQANVVSQNNNNQVQLGNSSIEYLRCAQSTINTFSDARDKTDIVDSTDGLNIINAIKARKFTWKSRTPDARDGKTQLGFIAQEIDEVLGDKNDYIHMVDKSNLDLLHIGETRLIPIFVKAIQELSAEVEQLKSQLNN